MDTGLEPLRENPVRQIDVATDTREILARARRQADERNFDDVFIVDMDSHHTESESWADIIAYLDDEVIRSQALDYLKNRTGTPPYGLNGDLALRYQDCGGRIPHQAARREAADSNGLHRDVVLARRAYESMSIDKQIVFPTPMLFLGMHPQFDMEPLLGNAYNRWTVDTLLAQDDRLKSMAFLPFNDADEALKTVEEFGDAPGVVGFMVTSVRNKPVHHNHYMKVYRALEERGLPLGFHAGYYWQDPSMMQINRFGSMHALSFVWCNVVHMHQLGDERPARALPRSARGVDRERARLGAVADAAPRPHLHDAHLGGAALEAQAERLHGRDVLHLAAARDRQPEGAGAHLRDDPGADPAALCVGLAALGLRPAGGDLGPPLPRRRGAQEHPRPQRPAHLRFGEVVPGDALPPVFDREDAGPAVALAFRAEHGDGSNAVSGEGRGRPGLPAQSDDTISPISRNFSRRRSCASVDGTVGTILLSRMSRPRCTSSVP